MAEANRTFWRQTGLPLVNRSARALAGWLAPAYGAGVLRLVPDLDQVEALAPEREALWARLEKASFLTTAEKRAAAGYGAQGAGGAAGIDAGEAQKFNPHHDGLGRFTFSPDGDVVPVAGKRPFIPPPPPKPGDPKPQYKEPKPGVSGKDGSKDTPSWTQGERPLLGENGDAFAKRLMDKKYGVGGWNDKGAGSEFSTIKKYGDRAF